MNKYMKGILGGATLIAFALLVTCLLSSSGKSENDAHGRPDNNLPQEVHAVSINEKIKFAGKNIPLERHDLRERLDRELLAFTFMHSTTFVLIKRANLYFPIIEPILKEYDIPDDFKYLAVVESYLNPRSVSPAKAAGLWQFLSETGKEYGLEVNSQVDERFNTEKATVAACQYLRDAYDQYGDWVLAAASYNAGKRRITTELEKQMTDSYFDLYLNEETSRYIFRIFAAKEILSHPKEYGFFLKKEDFYQTVRTHDIEVSSSVPDWAAWALANNTTFVQLKYFNLWIRDMKLDNKGNKTYIVKIPYTEDLDFDIKKVKIYNKNWVE